ncbi:MAG: hypothetical protein KDA25_04395 [Phycisphaerales bacterium]|nr:hypothetical protein [Phycisphaerales bacterium]
MTRRTTYGLAALGAVGTLAIALVACGGSPGGSTPAPGAKGATPRPVPVEKVPLPDEIPGAEQRADPGIGG